VFLIYEKNGYSRVSGLDTCKLMVESLAGLFKAEDDIIYDSYDTALNAGEGFRENLRRELHYTYSSKCGPARAKAFASDNKHFPGRLERLLTLTKRLSFSFPLQF
jgi:hypothetical protein